MARQITYFPYGGFLVEADCVWGGGVAVRSLRVNPQALPRTESDCRWAGDLSLCPSLRAFFFDVIKHDY